MSNTERAYPAQRFDADVATAGAMAGFIFQPTRSMRRFETARPAFLAL